MKHSPAETGEDTKMNNHYVMFHAPKDEQNPEQYLIDQMNAEITRRSKQGLHRPEVVYRTLIAEEGCLNRAICLFLPLRREDIEVGEWALVAPLETREWARKYGEIIGSVWHKDMAQWLGVSMDVFSDPIIENDFKPMILVPYAQNEGREIALHVWERTA